MTEAPIGDVTLVFTDIEGSTVLWESDPRAMSEALAVHDALMRETLAAHGGFEVKTEGDAFMVAFANPGPAVAWCAQVQLVLERLRWPAALLRSDVENPHPVPGLRVRMGVHRGTPECRTDPVTGRMDYFGTMVNLAARISGAAHGGQILVSGLAFEGTSLDDGLIVTDLGEHRLKGLQRPVRLLSVLPGPLALRRFPPPRTQTLRLRIAESDGIPRGLDGGRLEGALRQVTDALAARGEVLRYLGRAEEGEEDLQLALACARRLGDPQAEAFVLAALGRLYFHTARFADAQDCFEEASHEVLTAGDTWGGPRRCRTWPPRTPRWGVRTKRWRGTTRRWRSAATSATGGRRRRC